MALIFVYGTLKKGRGANRIFKSSKFIGEGVTIKDYFRMHSGGFPMVTADGHFHVFGELYEVTDPEVLKNLDYYEGSPHLFNRTTVDVRVGSDDFVGAEMYIFQRSTHGYEEVVPNDSNCLVW